MFQHIKINSSSILFKIIFLFLAVLLPIYILWISIYVSGYNMIRKEISNSSLAQASLYGNMLQEELIRIQTLQYECINDEDLQYLINAYDILNSYERSQYMLTVQKRLNIMKNSSHFIEHIAVHIPTMNKTISSTHGVIPLSDSWSEYFNEPNNNINSGLSYKNNEIYCNIEFPVISKSGRVPLFLMEIKLSNSSIKTMLNGFNQYPDSEFFLVNTDLHYYLSNGETDKIPQRILSLIKERETIGLYSTHIDNMPVEVTYVTLRAVGMHLVSVVPTGIIFSKIQFYRYIYLAFTAVSLIIILVFGLKIKKMIYAPVKTLVQSFKYLKSGDFAVRVSYNKKDEFQYLYESFNDMAINLQELIKQVFEQKILAQRSELKHLQSQINPHFLYNSFFNIYRMAKDEDYDNIVDFSRYLGEYYQYITRNSMDTVPLIKEIEHVATYLNIQRMRFRNILTVDVGEFPNEFSSFPVPRLMIQPIVENAFSHGLKNVESPYLSIHYLYSSPDFAIVVEDNGNSLSEEEFESLKAKLDSNDPTLETTAIVNIHRRLKLQFSKGSGIQIEKRKDGGLTVTILIKNIGDDYHVSNSDC